MTKKHPGCGWKLRKPGEAQSGLHLALPWFNGAGQQLSVFVLRDCMQKRAWEPAAPVGLQRAVSEELFEWSWIRCSHHIFFSKKYFLFWKKEKSADCHLKVSVKASVQRLALERIPFLRFLLSFLPLKKYLLLLIFFLYDIFLLCSLGWPQTCKLLLQDPRHWDYRHALPPL